MSEEFIVDAVRSPTGRFLGGFGGIRPVEQGCDSLRGLLVMVGGGRVGVGDVTTGCSAWRGA